MTGCPILGLDDTYTDLCAWDCEHGYCPDTACTLEAAGTVCPTLSGAGTGTSTTAYLDVYCDYGTLPSDLKDPAQRWFDAQADGGWTAALANYTNYMKEYPNTEKQFTEIVADFFHAPSGRLCLDPTNTECDVTIPCDQVGGTGVNSPAG